MLTIFHTINICRMLKLPGQ